MRIALVVAALIALAGVLFFASFTEVEPDDPSASDRYRAERLIETTREELSILEEKLAALQSLRGTIPMSDQAGRTKVEAAISATMEQRAIATRRLTEIEQALAGDSREALESVIEQLKTE